MKIYIILILITICLMVETFFIEKILKEIDILKNNQEILRKVLNSKDKR